MTTHSPGQEHPSADARVRPEDPAHKLPRVGVLLVHGIGEQTRFEHLESEVRKLASAMQAAGLKPQVGVRAAASAPYDSPQQVWDADDGAPVWIDLPDPARRIAFRGVWWADLDEPLSAWVKVRFWLWGLAMWVMPWPLLHAPQPPIHLPEHAGKLWARERAKLFLVGTVFVLLFGSLRAIQWVLRRVGMSIPLTELMVAYVGDVKLYQQGGRPGMGPLVDLGEAPRTAIRRRMVQALVDMALGGYERWNVLAHSLGTVLAFNGLMEPEAVLGRYLDAERWDAAARKGFTMPAPAEPPGLDAPPPAPLWQPAGRTLSRARLFGKLHGLLTYGSPLDTFATLWPRIVLRNAEAAFPAAFRWINVYDPTDPVAGALDFFGTAQAAAGAGQPAPPPAPCNVAYKARRAHLLSHIGYFSPVRGPGTSLGRVVGDWLAAPQPAGFGRPPTASWRWPKPDGPAERLQRVLQYLVWVLVAGVAAMVWTLWLPWAWVGAQKVADGCGYVLAESAFLTAASDAQARFASGFFTWPRTFQHLGSVLWTAFLASWIPVGIAMAVVAVLGLLVWTWRLIFRRSRQARA